MGFVTSYDDLARLRDRKTYDIYDAQMLSVVWETTPQTVERLLPPPLQPAKYPLAAASVASYPRTNFGITYREAALALLAEFNGEVGLYFLAMPVTNDMAMIGGREQFGYPKKIAEVAFYREGQAVGGWAERHGIRFFSVQAQLTGAVNAPDAQAMFADFAPPITTVYNFKYFPAPGGEGFDYPPRLIREEVEFRRQTLELGTATVVLNPSDFDPWHEVDVVRVLGAVYTQGDNSMRPGKVVAEADPIDFARYTYMKVDPL